MTDLENYRFFIDSPKPLLAIMGGWSLTAGALIELQPKFRRSGW